MSEPQPSMSPALWRPGAPVAVRNRYTRSWSVGFEIETVAGPDVFRVRRQSDGAVLPAGIGTEDLRLI